MGFGTLFIGYFFLVNISYFSLTDIIASSVMLMGIYKLSRFCTDFKAGLYVCSALTLVSLVELIFAMIDMIAAAEWITAVTPYISSVRYFIIFALNIYIMRGIRAISKEVAAGSLEVSARAAIPFSFIYIFAALFSLPMMGTLLGSAMAYVYFGILVVIVAQVISSLVIIYKAYMQICLPEDEQRKQKTSSFDPLEKLFDRMESSGREYAEYKLKKQIEKKEKAGKKGKK